MRFSLTAAAAAALLPFACGPSTFGDYPRAPVTVSPLSSPAGWTRVDEPKWFSASLPGPPQTSFETLDVQSSHVQMKSLTASDGATLWTWIRYFEVNSTTTMLDPQMLIRAGREDFLSIDGVKFLRDDPRTDMPAAPDGGSPAPKPLLDFVCTVAPHSPLDLSDRPMVARVRAYGKLGIDVRVAFAIAVWPASGSETSAQTFFDGFRMGG